MSDSITNNTPPLADDVLWGVAAIAAEIDRPRADVYYLLQHGKLPATKCGSMWVSTKSRLRAFFNKQYIAPSHPSLLSLPKPPSGRRPLRCG